MAHLEVNDNDNNDNVLFYVLVSLNWRIGPIASQRTKTQSKQTLVSSYRLVLRACGQTAPIETCT